jgi:hypothetical protein
MSGRGTRRARVRVERLIGQRDGARLTIDRLQFELSDADLVQLAAQLLAVLGGERRASLDVVGGAGGKVTIERRESEHEWVVCPDCGQTRRPIHWCNPKRAAAESEPHTIGLDPPTVENDPIGRFRGGSR